MIEHTKECPKQSTICPYSDAGCNHQVYDQPRDSVFLTVKYFMKYFGNIYVFNYFFKTQYHYVRLVSFGSMGPLSIFSVYISTYQYLYINLYSAFSR